MSEDFKQIVIGLGEVGQAVKRVLECEGIDIEGTHKEKRYDVIHICFGYSEEFIGQVEQWQSVFLPDLTIVHSTVPVGTCEKLKAVHSPIRGVHPFLEEGVRNFVKFFGGERSEEAAKIFQNKGVETFCTPKSENTEAMKLWDTEQYRTAILEMREIWHYCEKEGLDFNVVYTEANKTYNKGYEKLGRPEYKKYILKYVPGEIGGHCVEPNHKLLK